MNSYNFDNIDFDVDFGTVDKKDHDKLVEDAKQYEKEESEKKNKKWTVSHVTFNLQLFLMFLSIKWVTLLFIR